MRRLSWYTPPIGEMTGYGYAAIETIQALQRLKVQVYYNNFECKAHINFIQPELYIPKDPEQLAIGYTPWESTEIDNTWVDEMRKMDQIWATTYFVKEVYEKYEVNDNIHLVPHGINPDIFKIEDRQLTNKFVFLHIGGPASRKGGQEVVNAFIEVFANEPDVWLVIKARGNTEARIFSESGEVIGNAGLHPNIMVFTEDAEIHDLVRYYNNAHCFVYPTLGEGFGLIPFQAIATGLPTICTDLLGTADFAKLSMPLYADWQDCPDDHNIHIGKWAKPDLAQLRELMWDAYINWESHKKKAMQSARIIHNTMTWNHTAQKIIDLIGDTINE